MLTITIITVTSRYSDSSDSPHCCRAWSAQSYLTCGADMYTFLNC